MFSFTLFSIILFDNFLTNFFLFLNLIWPVLASPFYFCEFIFILTFFSFSLNILLIFLNYITSPFNVSSNKNLLNINSFVFYNTYSILSKLKFIKLF